MSISISDIVNVSIAVAPNAVATDGFGPLLFMSKEFIPVMGELPVQSFASLKELQDKFPSGEIYKAGTAWYGQKPTPKTMLVGAITSETTVPAAPASIVGGTASVLAAIKAITAGGLVITVNGNVVALTALDFSDAADFDAVATILNGAFTTAGAGVSVTQVTGKFTITTTLTGSNASISAGTGTVAVALKIDAASTPIITLGQNAKSIASDLANAMNTKFWFFYVCVERSLRGTSEQQSAATWCEASGKVFGWADNDANILVSGTENSFKVAKTSNLRNTLCVFDASVNGNEYPEVSILARAATVNFNVANSVLILAFKKGPTITTADLSSGQLTALQSYNGNAFISVDDNVMFYNGRMADGTWFDTVQGVEWLTQQTRNNVFNLFYQSTTRIPWTDVGVGMVNQKITLALELARTNGLNAPGFDNEGVFYPTGYKVISTPLELLQSQKGERIWEGSSFIAIGSGALQGAQINGIFVQ